MGNDRDKKHRNKQVVCLNTAVNNAGRGFGANGVGSDNLGQSDVPDNQLGTTRTDRRTDITNRSVFSFFFSWLALEANYLIIFLGRIEDKA